MSSSSPLPVLPTSVIGSYSMPEWLERAKNDYLSRRLSRRDLDEMHDAVRKAAIKDQETAGLDIVSDGEAQRDNMIDYFIERMPGVQVDLGSKRFYYDFYESSVTSKLSSGSLGLSEEARFLTRFTERRGKISISGPHTLVKRVRNSYYPSEEAFAIDLARLLNFEMKELVNNGITELQIDEPYYSGFPEDLPWAVKAINTMVDGVNANITLHICYGNRYGKPSFEGSYRYLFPKLLEARVHTVSLEFARRGDEDLELFREFNVPFKLGYGVIDVKSQDCESPALVADRIRRALEIVPPERLVINPDCGCVRLPREVALNKLTAMVEGTRLVRAQLGLLRTMNVVAFTRSGAAGVPVRFICSLSLGAAIVSISAVSAAPQSNRAPRPAGTMITVRAVPVPLNPDNRSQSAVGPFVYAGGLVLTSSQTDRLHGLSDLEITGSDRFTAVGDEGVFVTGRIGLDKAGHLADVRDTRLQLLTGEDGQPLGSKEEADSEGLALFPNGDRLVSFERDHRIWLYPANGSAPRPVPKPDVTFPVANGGMEALAADPDAGPDAYVVGAELTGETWTCRISTACTKGPTVPRPEGMSLVALKRLAGGRTVYLLRAFAPATGNRVALVIMRRNAIEAQLDLARPLTIDNFEGVAAVSRPGGVIRFYLISDDNASPTQRTILLAFDWRPTR